MTLAPFRNLSQGIALCVLSLAIIPHLCYAQDSTAIATLRKNAIALKPLVSTVPATKFLEAVADLPEIPARAFYVNKQTRELIDSAEYVSRTDSGRAGFEPRPFGSQFYYNTRYGTPLAFVRALDLACKQGILTLENSSIIDFGFGSIGQLRLMASLGATVHGIEVDELLEKLYSQTSDTGTVMPSIAAQAKKAGSLHLHYGQFPADSEIVAKLTGTFDIFVSKNTLKRGYIHPEREADPRILINLGVSDSEFVASVSKLLKPGGIFMIYNLHPAKSKPEEKYLPWSDGRCPFDRTLMESIGFEIISFDTDDTEFALTMAEAIGWDANMDLAKDLFGTYTMLKKR